MLASITIEPKYKTLLNGIQYSPSRQSSRVRMVRIAAWKGANAGAAAQQIPRSLAGVLRPLDVSLIDRQ
jgi:hypothetical protein